MPRDISGNDLINILTKIGYEATRQRGSHVRISLETIDTKHSVTIPLHNPIKIGTLNNILNDVASANKISKKDLIEKLFNK